MDSHDEEATIIFNIQTVSLVALPPTTNRYLLFKPAAAELGHGMLARHYQLSRCQLDKLSRGTAYTLLEGSSLVCPFNTYKVSPGIIGCGK